MTNQEALEILAQVKAQLGRNYKSAIRQAWFDGNYRGQCLGEWSQQLQLIRNTFGPSWLVKARPSDLRGVQYDRLGAHDPQPYVL